MVPGEGDEIRYVPVIVFGFGGLVLPSADKESGRGSGRSEAAPQVSSWPTGSWKVASIRLRFPLRKFCDGNCGSSMPLRSLVSG